MKKYLYMIAGCLLMAFYACSSDSPADEPVTPPTPGGNEGTEGTVAVEISTDIHTRAVVVTDFEPHAEISVFAKTYAKPDAPDMVADVKGTWNGSKWEMSPKVLLKEGERTFIYALHPYTKGLTNLSKIPVDVAQQVDILYSGGSVPVSHTTYQAKLTLNHALSLLSFNIASQGYSGNGALKSIEISGEEVYTQGTMNIENGRITGVEKGSFNQSFDKKITAAGWSAELPNMWSIPFSTKTKTAVAKINVDGKEYKANFPEVEMKSGYQYIFRLVLTDFGLEFIPSQTETISLKQETDAMGQLEGYGVLRLTHSAQEFVLPTLSGDNVFGTVNWGDESNNSYAAGLQHTYTATGAKEMVIESWNSTGFELRNLTGIEAIDISQY